MENLTDEELCLAAEADDVAADALREQLRRAHALNAYAKQQVDEAQAVLLTAKAAVLAACNVLMESDRWAEAISLQPWLQKLEIARHTMSLQRHAHVAIANTHDGPGCPSSYKHHLTKLWLNIALQSCSA
jgi:replication fork clamp-binding protein CrfC